MIKKLLIFFLIVQNSYADSEWIARGVIADQRFKKLTKSKKNKKEVECNIALEGAFRSLYIPEMRDMKLVIEMKNDYLIKFPIVYKNSFIAQINFKVPKNKKDSVLPTTPIVTNLSEGTSIAFLGPYLKIDHNNCQINLNYISPEKSEARITDN